MACRVIRHPANTRTCNHLNKNKVNNQVSDPPPAYIAISVILHHTLQKTANLEGSVRTVVTLDTRRCLADFVTEQNTNPARITLKLMGTLCMQT